MSPAFHGPLAVPQRDGGRPAWSPVADWGTTFYGQITKARHTLPLVAARQSDV